MHTSRPDPDAARNAASHDLLRQVPDDAWRRREAASLSQLTVPDLYELLSTYRILVPGESARQSEEVEHMIVAELIGRLKRDGTRIRTHRSMLSSVFADMVELMRALLTVADMDAAFTAANIASAQLTLGLGTEHLLIITVVPTPDERRLGDERWRLSCGDYHVWGAGGPRPELVTDMKVCISDTGIPYAAEFSGGERYYISGRVAAEDVSPATADGDEVTVAQDVSAASAEVVVDPYALGIVAERCQSWLGDLDRTAFLAVAAARSASPASGLIQSRGLPFEYPV